eukprot:1085264-Pleurochrysis_carterae.AAC.1
MLVTSRVRGLKSRCPETGLACTRCTQRCNSGCVASLAVCARGAVRVAARGQGGQRRGIGGSTNSYKPPS